MADDVHMGLSGVYWSRLPQTPRKVKWPVQIVEFRQDKVKVFCRADNAWYVKY